MGSLRSKIEKESRANIERYEIIFIKKKSNMNMEELGMSDDDLFDLLDQKSNKDSTHEGAKTKVSIEELGKELEILFINLKGAYKICMKKYVVEFTKILDPNGTGMFDYSTLLTLVAEKTEKLEERIKKEKHLSLENP